MNGSLHQPEKPCFALSAFVFVLIATTISYAAIILKMGACPAAPINSSKVMGCNTMVLTLPTGKEWYL